jgi:alkyl hydroperoxide reductase subunit F
MIYDVIIIGSGPAGMTAGIYAVRREMKTLIIGREPGGQLIWANEIENYPGFESIKSFELIERIKSQASKAGVDFLQEEVKEIKKTSAGNFFLKAGQDTFESRTVIIAMGLSPRRLAIPGEAELNGRGVSFCANCDGPFYKDKVVAVVGGGNSAVDAAEVMSKIARQVYLIHRGATLKAFDALVNKVKSQSNIEIIPDSEVKQIKGSQKVEGVVIVDNASKTEREIVLNGVFIEVGRIASTDLVAGLVELNDFRQIIVNHRGETKTPGLFAAGDVTDAEFKQITVAMGQATVAALSAYQYLQTDSQSK